MSAISISVRCKSTVDFTCVSGLVPTDMFDVGSWALHQRCGLDPGSKLVHAGSLNLGTGIAKWERLRKLEVGSTHLYRHTCTLTPGYVGSILHSKRNGFDLGLSH